MSKNIWNIYALRQAHKNGPQNMPLSLDNIQALIEHFYADMLASDGFKGQTNSAPDPSRSR